jgi:hypothetical protein
MNEYQKELQKLKPWDEVQDIVSREGYDFIYTSGHGYLVIPRSDKYAKLARSICQYGFKGKLAYYLEEDSEAPDFLARIKNRPIYGQQYKLTGKKGEACIMNGSSWHESRVN